MKRNYYIFSDTLLKRKNNTLYFDTIEKDDNDDSLCNPKSNFSQSLRNRIVPIEDVNALFAYGQIHFNTKLMSFLSGHLIPLHVFDISGNYSGAFYPKDIGFKDNLYLKQALSVSSDNARADLSRELIFALHNNADWAYKEINKLGFNVREYIGINDDLNLEAGNTNDIAELSRIKSDINFFFRDCWFDIFKYRFRINKNIDVKIKAAFDFIGMMVNATCLSEIYKCGLNPSLGIFEYAGSKNKFSLSKDIGDIFKPVIIKRLLYKMLKKGEVEFRSFITSKNFCMLNQETIRYIVLRFDEELNSTFCSTVEDNSINLHNLISMEFRKLAESIDKGGKYNAYRISD